jgi:hypothetical protein
MVIFKDPIMAKSKAMKVIGKTAGRKEATVDTTTASAAVEAGAHEAIEPLPPATVILVNLDDAKKTMLAGLSRLGVKLEECKAVRLRGKLAYCDPKSTIIVIGFLDKEDLKGNQIVSILQSDFPKFFEKVLRVSDQTDLRPRSDLNFRPVVSPNLPTVAEAIREMLKAN